MNRDQITGYVIQIKTDRYANVDLRPLEGVVPVEVSGKRWASITVLKQIPYDTLVLDLLTTLSKLEIKPGNIDMHNIRYEPGLIDEAIANAVRLVTRFGTTHRKPKTVVLDKCGVWIKVDLLKEGSSDGVME